MHTYALSNCEPSKHILKICFIESTLLFISLLSLWVLETESLKPSPSNPIWWERTTFLKVKISFFKFLLLFFPNDDDSASEKPESSFFLWFLFLSISLEATKRGHGFGSLIRDRFKMDLYTCFAHCHGIACWKNFHLSHHFCPGRVPWWPHGTLGMPKKKNVSFIV